MNLFKKIFVYIILSVGLIFLQILWNWYWPEPFNHIQIIFAALSVWLMYAPSQKYFFSIALTMFVLLHILSSNVGGISTAGAIVSLLTLSRLSRRIFTGHSASTALFLTVIGVVIFRVVYLSAALGLDLIDLSDLAWGRGLVLALAWEIFSTGFVAIILFLTAIFCSRRFNPRYVLMDNKIIYG